jgi:hypothetical protein
MKRYVANVFAAVKLVFWLCIKRKLKLLTSEEGDIAQTTRTDNVTPEAQKRIANFDNTPNSFITTAQICAPHMSYCRTAYAKSTFEQVRSKHTTVREIFCETASLL